MKKFALILLSPLLLALVAAALAPKLAPEERLRAEASALLSDAAGHEARIGGAVRFSAFPWPSLTIENLIAGDPALAQLEVPEVRIVLDLLPLLTGRAKASRIELWGPELVVAERDDPLDLLSGLVTKFGTSQLSAEVKLIDGRILRRRQGNAAASEVILADMSGDLSWRGGKHASARGHLIWRDEPLDVDLRLSGLAEMAQGGVGSLQVRADGPPVTMSFSGAIKLAHNPSLEGAITVSSRQLRSTLGWLGFEAPTERGFGPFALNAQTQLTGQGATLGQARLELDGNVSEGGFTVRGHASHPVIQGSFASDMLDLTPYGELKLDEPGGGAWSGDALDVGKLGGFDLDLRFSAAQVRTGNTPFEGLAASAMVKSGKLTLAIGDSSAWQGTFRASAQISAISGGADAKVELAGDDVALAQALGDLFNSQRLEGTGSFRLALATSGGSIAAMVERLTGSFTLTGRDGAVVGIDVPRILSRLERRPLSGAADLRGGRTPYDEIDVAASIRTGIAHIERLNVESPQLRIEINGESSLARRDLDLEGTAQLVAAANVAPFDLPFAVRGS